MISAFRTSPAASGRGLRNIDRIWFRVPQKISKIEKSLEGRIKPIFNQTGKLELLV